MAHDEYDHLRESADEVSVAPLINPEELDRAYDSRTDWSGGSQPENDTEVEWTEEKSILAADHDIQMAQYQALHNRLEDFTTYLVEMGYLAKQLFEPVIGGRSSTDEYMFELVEAYLDQVNEHEDRGPLDQIFRPDMEGFTGEPE